MVLKKPPSVSKPVISTCLDPRQESMQRPTRTYFHKHSFNFFLIPNEGVAFTVRENFAILLIYSLRQGNHV